MQKGQVFVVACCALILGPLPALAQDDGLLASDNTRMASELSGGQAEEQFESTAPDSITRPQTETGSFGNMTELMLFQELPKVTTASKKVQSIADATSIVTVITKEDIERWGVRTIYELLKRVPGFFPSIQATWPLIGSRGMMADSNDHILFLVDGHPQNSIIGQGYQQQDLLPVIEKVEKVEIIRGPGSVLWGSNAVWGIINIITKTGSVGQNYRTTFGYGHGDGMFSGNYLYTFGGENHVKGLVSASYWQSNGYDRPGKTGPGAAWNRDDAGDVKGNVEFPWGEVGDWPPIDKQREGYELYAKLKFGKNEILGRVVESNIVYPWDTWMNKPGADLTMRKAYLEYKNEVSFGETIEMQSTLYGDLLLQNRFPSDDSLFVDSGTVGDNTLQDQSNEELAFGMENMVNWRLFDNNDLKVGLKITRTKIGPNRDTRFNAFLNNQDVYDEGTDEGLQPQDNVYIGVLPGYDNNGAVYTEDSWMIGDTTLFAGMRFDYNDFREMKGVFLPRAGAVQKISDAFTAKYVMNTGYLRPNATYSKTVGIIVDTTRGPTQDILRVKESEEIMSHDLQVYWKQDNNYAAITGYYMQIKNYISFDANNTPQGYKNMGNAVSMGAEAEVKYQFMQHLLAYGNYSFTIAKLEETLHQGAITNDQDVFLNYPTHLFNVGVDYVLDKNNTLNLNVNGWGNMPYVKPIGEADTYGEFSTLFGEYYVDLNIQSKQILGSSVDVKLFVMNLLDNTHKIGMVVNNGVYYPRGRQIGGQVSFAW